MPTGIYARPYANRFWARVNKTDTCWLWTGPVNTSGYGHMRRHHRSVTTHRLIWEITYGTIPKGKCVCHTCDIRRCVNPAHLFLASAGENNTDRHSKGRTATGQKNGKAKLTDLQATVIRELYPLINQPQLARLFGVSSSVISQIITYKSYKTGRAT